MGSDMSSRLNFSKVVLSPSYDVRVWTCAGPQKCFRPRRGMGTSILSGTRVRRPSCWGGLVLPLRAYSHSLKHNGRKPSSCQGKLYLNNTCDINLEFYSLSFLVTLNFILFYCKNISPNAIDADVKSIRGFVEQHALHQNLSTTLHSALHRLALPHAIARVSSQPLVGDLHQSTTIIVNTCVWLESKVLLDWEYIFF